MGNIAKGIETKKQIISASRKLFYEHGYNQTSSRMISSSAGTNLGLLNYYFDGKIELGKTIYYELRNEFNALIEKSEPSFNDFQMFFFSSLVELTLCLKNRNYGLFYFEIINEKSVHEVLIQFIHSKIIEYGHYDDVNYPMLAAISITSVKPEIVRYALDTEKSLSISALSRYYLEEQLHYFGYAKSESALYLNTLKKYHIDVTSNLTPVFIRMEP